MEEYVNCKICKHVCYDEPVLTCNHPIGFGPEGECPIYGNKEEEAECFTNTESVWVVEQGEKDEGGRVKAVCRNLARAEAIKASIESGPYFYHECDYVVIKDWRIDETI